MTGATKSPARHSYLGGVAHHPLLVRSLLRSHGLRKLDGRSFVLRQWLVVRCMQGEGIRTWTAAIWPRHSFVALRFGWAVNKRIRRVGEGHACKRKGPERWWPFFLWVSDPRSHTGG